MTATQHKRTSSHSQALVERLRFLALVESRAKKSFDNPKRELRNFNRLVRMAGHFGCLDTVFLAKYGVLRIFIDSIAPTVGEKERYVYVMEDPINKIVKVGVASRLNYRTSGIKNGNPNARCVYSTLRIPFAEIIERKVLKLLKPFKVSGEWFRCSCDDAIAAINDAVGSLV